MTKPFTINDTLYIHHNDIKRIAFSPECVLIILLNGTIYRITPPRLMTLDIEIIKSKETKS